MSLKDSFETASASLASFFLINLHVEATAVHVQHSA